MVVVVLVHGISCCWCLGGGDRDEGVVVLSLSALLLCYYCRGGDLVISCGCDGDTLL